MVRFVWLCMSTSLATFAAASSALACVTGLSTVIRDGKVYQVYLRCGLPRPSLAAEEQRASRLKRPEYPPAPMLTIMEDASPPRWHHRSAR